MSAWVASDDGGGMGVRVSLAGSPAERVAQLAEQVQEWEVEQLCWAGRSATWPECSEHPGSHPLEPTVAGGVAVWRCPGRSGWPEPSAAWSKRPPRLTVRRR